MPQPINSVFAQNPVRFASISQHRSTRVKEPDEPTLATLIPKNFVVADQFDELIGRLLMPITKQPNCQKSVLRPHPDKVQSKDAALAAARRRTLRRAVTHERGGKIEPTAVAVNRSSQEN
ncbi:hypothetical protein NZK35_21365 [Stieleria sp. ICT_E10.1]|uniref:hypothetical protein n=1 Tax=Stieleria sedimenti TaxID=2976331 RepID=UPI0021807F37|nr:hypothetical protein [Stieleria sedimenti]MCS7469210.1 hypothetical protein [Stieleria sedimenti]